jgi:glutathione S-transferase
MILYENPMSGNCYKVRLLLGMLGIDFERRELDVVDRSDRPAVLGGLNPALRIPTVVFDDGRALGESDAILFHFAEGTPYLPSDAFERAQVLQWLFFEQYSHEPNLANARFWALAGIEVSGAAREEKRIGGEKALRALEEGLTGREWLVGSAFSIADIGLYAYTHVAPEGGFDLAPYPAIRAWIDRVAGRPGYIPLDS